MPRKKCEPDRTTKTMDELLEIAKAEGVDHIQYFDMAKEFDDEPEPMWHFDIYDRDPHRWHHLKTPWFSWRGKYFYVKTWVTWTTYGRTDATQG